MLSNRDTEHYGKASVTLYYFGEAEQKKLFLSCKGIIFKERYFYVTQKKKVVGKSKLKCTHMAIKEDYWWFFYSTPLINYRLLESSAEQLCVNGFKKEKMYLE